MNKILIASINIFFIVGLVFQPITKAESDHSKSIEVVMEEILENHNWDLVSEIQCAEIERYEWEELGEAVMSERHPDEEEHELMDQMMGGEGSESLSFAHERMARAYLNCFDNEETFSQYGMMGRIGMMYGGRQPYYEGTQGTTTDTVIENPFFWTTMIFGVISIVLIFNLTRPNSKN